MSDLNALTERLVRLLGDADFLAMKGLANEVPIFIQTYDAAQEDGIRRLAEAVTNRLRARGVGVKALDLFELVLEELEARGRLGRILEREAQWSKAELLETLQNLADPETRLIPRLISAIAGGEKQLTLLTGAGRLFPFLRTHSLLESLQPAMLHYPIVLFFPGEYTQDPGGGSHLRLFGAIPSPRIHNPYYRAMNLDHYRLAPR